MGMRSEMQEILHTRVGGECVNNFFANSFLKEIDLFSQKYI